MKLDTHLSVCGLWHAQVLTMLYRLRQSCNIDQSDNAMPDNDHNNTIHNFTKLQVMIRDHSENIAVGSFCVRLLYWSYWVIAPTPLIQRALTIALGSLYKAIHKQCNQYHVSMLIVYQVVTCRILIGSPPPPANISKYLIIKLSLLTPQSFLAHSTRVYVMTS